MCTTGLSTSAGGIIVVESEATKRERWAKREKEERERLERSKAQAAKVEHHYKPAAGKVYAVMGTCGEYSDTQIWVVRVFATKASAEEYAHAANAWLKAHTRPATGKYASKWSDVVTAQSPYDDMYEVGSHLAHYYIDDEDYPDAQVYTVEEVDADSGLLADLLARADHE